MGIDQFRQQKIIRERIKAFLREFAEGPEKAIPRPLVQMHVCFNGSDRHFRMLYKGLGIASCEKGLYWPRECDVAGYKEYLINGYGHERAAEKIKELYLARPELRSKSAGIQEQLPFEGART